VLFVFAAGNDGLDNDVSPNAVYPCSYDLPNIVCVAATDQNDARAPFSNFGATTVDLAAPGDNVLGAQARFTTVFSDSMDTADSNWAFAGGWGKTTLHAASAPSSLTDSPVDYADDASTSNNSARLAGPVDLTGRTGCHLAYDARFSLAANDYLDTESSVDGTDWALEFYDGDPSHAASSNGLFLPTIVDLTHRDGTPALGIRFGITSLGIGVADGGYVDNVAIRCLSSGQYTGAAEEFAYLSGTSMATPHVSGVAALVLSHDPALTPAQVKARVLAGVDPVADLSGKTTTGGRLNAHWAVQPLPGVTTGVPTAVGLNGMTLNASVNPRLQATTLRFEYGTTTAYGLATPVEQLPAAGTPQAVSASIVGLQPSTAYHCRVVAENATGTTFGVDQIASTLAPAPDPQLLQQPQPQPDPLPQPQPQPQSQPQPQPEAPAQTQPPPPLVPLPTHSTPRRTMPKPGPCARLRGAKKTVCLRRQAALRRCARMKPGRAKTRCIVRARRIR
jgi:subtilisin family serine protease